MIDYMSLPSSKALQLNVTCLRLDSEFKYTYTVNVDEQKLYKQLSKRLIALEKSLEANKVELETIETKANEIHVAIEEKNELLLRIDWLHRLYKAREEIGLVDTKEKAIQLRKSITRVQVCPMKKQLMSEINTLEKSLPSEIQPSEVSIEIILMEKAITDLSNVFINLGKTGREYVIKDVLKQFGDAATVENVKIATIALEKRVESLLVVNERTEMIARLEQLPLTSYLDLNPARKECIADRLIESKKWKGLASLDRMILLYDKEITNEERKLDESKSIIQTENGKVALVLNIQDGENDLINKMV